MGLDLKSGWPWKKESRVTSEMQREIEFQLLVYFSLFFISPKLHRRMELCSSKIWKDAVKQREMNRVEAPAVTKENCN